MTSDDPDLVKRLELFAVELKQAAAVCADKGHTNPVWYPYTVSNRSNPLYDTVTGVCHSCLAGLERPLDDEERARIDDFYKMMHQPMTI